MTFAILFIFKHESLLKPLKLQFFIPIQLLHKFTNLPKKNISSPRLALLTEMWDYNSYRRHIPIFPIHFSTSGPSPSSHCLLCTNRCTMHREKLGHIKMFLLREQSVKKTPPENPPAFKSCQDCS